MSTQIVIGNQHVNPVEYKGQRVVTLAMIDKIHQRPEGTASRNFKTNRDYFEIDDDFYLIDFTQKDVFRPFEINVPPRGLTVLTESGYLLLVKSFTDKLAWKVQKQLVKSYFIALEKQDSRQIALPPQLIRYMKHVDAVPKRHFCAMGIIYNKLNINTLKICNI